MRFPIAYYLILLYVSVMFKPLIPIAKDALYHMFSEGIHRATVHIIYGSNHLETELSKTASDNANSKQQNSVNAEDPVPVHVSTGECLYSHYFNSTGKNYASLKLSKLKAGFNLKNFPPPRFS
jgi:hypothetical protein